jgi:YHYH protein
MMGFPTCTCSKDADYTKARYNEIWSINETTSDATITIRTLGIPNHPFHEGRQEANGFAVCPYPITVTLPMKPIRAENVTDTPRGIIGVLKTGAFVYNPLTGMQTVAKYEARENRSLDKCDGHADLSCRYHYHAISKLAECTHDALPYDNCELIGHMLDGFPIYSHCFHHGKNRTLASCYKLALANSTGTYPSDWVHSLQEDCDLDEANGYLFTADDNITNQYGKRIVGYGYVATDTYPYVMPLYAGTQWSSITTLDDAQVEALWPGTIEHDSDVNTSLSSSNISPSEASSSEASLSAHGNSYVLSIVALSFIFVATRF